MQLPTLDLPEPAHALFGRTGAFLEERLSQIVPSGRHWWLGGGTVLAAQWQHRISTDVDIFLPANSGISAIAPQWDRTFTDGMKRLGATRLDVQPKSLKFAFPEGRVEITALDPIPLIDAFQATVDGSDIWVLPNVCILSGKLEGRGMTLPPRDVFDICVAAEKDPRALQGAVNHLHEQTRAAIVAGLQAGLDHFRKDVTQSILGSDQPWLHLLHDGPKIAAQAIISAVYREVDLTIEDGRARIVVESRGGDRTTMDFHYGEDLVKGLIALGLEQWMMAQSGTLKAFAESAAEKIELSQTDHLGND